MARDRKLVRAFVRGAKNSPWILIALGLHVILAAALSVMIMRRERQKTGASASLIAVAATRLEAPEVAVAEPEIDRTRIPANTRVELVTFEAALAFVPTEEPPPEIDWHADVGDPTGSGEPGDSPSGGTSIGVGKGGHHGTGVPSGIIGPRPGTGGGGASPGRPTRGGGVVATEEAVLEGLRWLMRHQDADGSWSAARLHEHCTTRTACIPPDPALDGSFDVGMTSLALLAFLGHGFSLDSRVEIVDEALGRPPRAAGEIVKRGIRWLIERQKPDGSFSDGRPFELPENDTLPTMALCEAWGLTPGSTLLRQRAQRAIDFLIAAQRRTADGAPWGWGVGSQRDLDGRRARGELAEEAFEVERRGVDLSITCWVVMALRSAQSCGFRVPQEVLAGALACAVDASESGPEANSGAVDREDRFTYHAARRAALGMLVRAFAGGAIEDPFLAAAARDIAADPPQLSQDRLSVDFYYWYFATLALNQYDGPESPRAGSGAYWDPWNEGLVAALLPLQDRTRKEDVCARGGWLQEARGNRRGRALYNTALNVLTLEVYYRFANVFGSASRDGAGGRDK